MKEMLDLVVALSSERGYVWASNCWLGGRLSFSGRTASRLLGYLRDDRQLLATSVRYLRDGTWKTKRMIIPTHGKPIWAPTRQMVLEQPKKLGVYVPPEWVKVGPPKRLDPMEEQGWTRKAAPPPPPSDDDVVARVTASYRARLKEAQEAPELVRKMTVQEVVDQRNRTAAFLKDWQDDPQLVAKLAEAQPHRRAETREILKREAQERVWYYGEERA
jgi:hypothetical protein